MNHTNQIVGTWRIPTRFANDKDEFMHVGGDGRIVHFVFADSSCSRVQPMKLWYESLGENRYRVRAKLGHESWIVELIPTESGMTIQREENAFYLTSAFDSELPSWYPARLEKALLEMSTSEADHEDATQANGSKGDKPSK
jgi:hypothetical protein